LGGQSSARRSVVCHGRDACGIKRLSSRQAWAADFLHAGVGWQAGGAQGTAHPTSSKRGQFVAGRAGSPLPAVSVAWHERNACEIKRFSSRQVWTGDFSHAGRGLAGGGAQGTARPTISKLGQSMAGRAGSPLPTVNAAALLFRSRWPRLEFGVEC